MSQTDNQFTARTEETKIFFARIENLENGAFLSPGAVSSIHYTVYPLGTIDNQRKEPVSGHRRIEVPLSVLTEGCRTSAVFPTGYNFRHAPDCRTRPIFPTVGKYEVFYTLALTGANPIQLSYRFSVE